MITIIAKPCFANKMPLSIISAAVMLSTVMSLVSGQGAPKPVYFSFIVSNGEYGYRSSGVVPSVDIALEAIENQQLLPGYNLTFETVRNSKVCLCNYTGACLHQFL